jgi:hypothetical protein
MRRDNGDQPVCRCPVLHQQSAGSLEVENLRARLERLERRTRMVVAGWVLSVVVFMLFGTTVRQATSQPEILRAQRIEVVDATGRTRIALAVHPDGEAGLILVDAAGRTRAGLMLTPDGSPGLILRDAAGRTRVGLVVRQEGTPDLGLTDVTGRLRILLFVHPDGSPGLRLQDAAGQPRVLLVVPPDGTPGLTFWDAAARVLFRAP